MLQNVCKMRHLLAPHPVRSASDAEAYLACARPAAGRKFLNARTSVQTGYAGRAGDSLRSKLTEAVSAVCHP